MAFLLWVGWHAPDRFINNDRRQGPRTTGKLAIFNKIEFTTYTYYIRGGATGKPVAPDIFNYFTSTFAPASSSFFLAASASALLAPSSTGFGAPSTSALASARPRPAFTSRTALITAIFLSAGTEATITSNCVCASAAGAAAPPAAAPPAGAAIMGAAA